MSGWEWFWLVVCVLLILAPPKYDPAFWLVNWVRRKRNGRSTRTD